MVDNGTVAAAFGLGPFTGIIYDIRVNVGQGVYGQVRIAFPRKGHGLSREPLKGPVLSYVNHGVGTEFFCYETVKGKIVVGGRQVGIVNHLSVFKLFVFTPGWLDGKEDVSVQKTAEIHPSLMDKEVPRRASPGLLKLLPHLCGKFPDPGKDFRTGDRNFGLSGQFSRGEVAPFRDQGGKELLGKFLA